jgi:hypothetical protein
MTLRGRDEFQLDFFKLKEQIERDKLELKRAEEELKKVGSSMKSDYLRSMSAPGKARSMLGLAAGPVNKMCLKCFNSCKQPQAVRIFHCARYEPVD